MFLDLISTEFELFYEEYLLTNCLAVKKQKKKDFKGLLINAVFATLQVTHTMNIFS
jgi:hypothetical protein